MKRIVIEVSEDKFPDSWAAAALAAPYAISLSFLEVEGASPPPAPKPRERRMPADPAVVVAQSNNNKTTQAVYAAMKAGPSDKVWSHEEVMAVLLKGGWSPTGISPVLSVLRRVGKIERIGKGHRLVSK